MQKTLRRTRDIVDKDDEVVKSEYLKKLSHTKYVQSFALEENLSKINRS